MSYKDDFEEMAAREKAASPGCDGCGVKLLYAGTVNCNVCGGALCGACIDHHDCDAIQTRALFVSVSKGEKAKAGK